MEFFKKAQGEQAKEVYESKYENKVSWQSCGAYANIWSSSQGESDLNIKYREAKEGTGLRLQTGFRVYEGSGAKEAVRQGDAGVVQYNLFDFESLEDLKPGQEQSTESKFGWEAGSGSYRLLLPISLAITLINAIF